MDKKAPTLDVEFKYFEGNRPELLQQFRGKFIVIKDQKVIGEYDSEADAYAESVKVHKLGTFLIQHCLPEKDLPQQVFHSRVVF